MRCRICGKEVNSMFGYIVEQNGIEMPYCSKEEYDSHMAELEQQKKQAEKRQRVEDLVMDIIWEVCAMPKFGKDFMNTWLSWGTIDDLYDFLNDNGMVYKAALQKISDKDVYLKLKYMNGIMTNKFKPYAEAQKQIKEKRQKQEEQLNNPDQEFIFSAGKGHFKRRHGFSEGGRDV